MANPEHLAILEKGVEAWNQWRRHSGTIPDLRDVAINFAPTLTEIQDNRRFDWRYVDRSPSWSPFCGITRRWETNLVGADLSRCLLCRSDLSWTNLQDANFSKSDLSGATLVQANLTSARFIDVRLTGAKIIDSDLSFATLARVTLEKATLTNCWVFGISSWSVTTDELTEQKNLIITPLEDRSMVVVDNLEVAQFIYLLLNNAKIRHVIDTITSKVVLILGRHRRNPQPLQPGAKSRSRRHSR